MNLQAKDLDNTPRQSLVLFFTLTAFAAVAAMIALASIPADPKNSVLFGFSLQRLAMLGIMLALTALFSLAAVLSSRNHPQMVEFNRAYSVIQLSQRY
jgi:hypothetical protein